MASAAWTLRLIAEFDAADQKAQELVTGLSPEQLNWQPGLGAWSVGQCLEHLCIANEVYLPAISSSLAGKPISAAQEIRLGWLSRWFVNSYIEPSPQSKHARAPKKIVPGERVERSVLDRFQRSNQAARELGLALMFVDIKSPDDLETAFASMKKSEAEALFVTRTNLTL